MTVWNNTKCNIVMLELIISYMDMDNLPKLLTFTKLMVRLGILCNKRVVQYVKKHFVQDFGARSQHRSHWKDYEEDDEEHDNIMDLQNIETMKTG